MPGNIFLEGTPNDWTFTESGRLVVHKVSGRTTSVRGTTIYFRQDSWTADPVAKVFVPNMPQSAPAPDDSATRDKALVEVIAAVQALRR